jgi:hypothetical protein
MKWEQFERWGKHNLQYGTPKRKLTTLVKPLAGAALVLAALSGASSLIKRSVRSRED